LKVRQVVTRRTSGVRELPKRERSGEQEGYDTYRERMLKYIPVETVVVWIGIFGSMSAIAYNEEFFPIFARWALILGMIGTWIYLSHVEQVRDRVHLVVSTIGFMVWVFALGVLPFSAFPWYNQVAGALLLPAYVVLVPLIDVISERV